MKIIEVNKLNPNIHSSIMLPLQVSVVAAGFPSPADDYKETSLDLSNYLICHPEATYYVKVSGDSMIDAGIFHNDILVVDRLVEATHNKIVIAEINNEFTVKKLYKRNNIIKLLAANNNYPEIIIDNNQHLRIWGVVIGSVRKFI